MNLELIVLSVFAIFILFYNSSQKENIISSSSSLFCELFYLENKQYYDTINTKFFNDKNIRQQLFPNFQRIYSSIPKDDCILDIGSNVGDISEIFHKYYQNNRIYLAEPLDYNCEKTKKKFNSLSQIIIIRTAIGLSHDKIVWEYKGAGDMMYIKRILTVTSNVTFMTLDSYYDKFVKYGNVFFLKIDVEGYEDEVLFTGKKLLSEGKIRYIYFEYHRTDSTKCKTSCSSLIIYLEQFGYHCYLIGKYNMIRIASGCFKEIDSQKLAHVVGIKKSEKNEKKFVEIYNKLYLTKFTSNVVGII